MKFHLDNFQFFMLRLQMSCGEEGGGGTSFVVHQLGGKVYCIQLFCYGMFSL
jgi:hypothetical protein